MVSWHACVHSATLVFISGFIRYKTPLFCKGPISYQSNWKPVSHQVDFSINQFCGSWLDFDPPLDFNQRKGSMKRWLLSLTARAIAMQASCSLHIITSLLVIVQILRVIINAFPRNNSRIIIKMLCSPTWHRISQSQYFPLLHCHRSQSRCLFGVSKESSITNPITRSLGNEMMYASFAADWWAVIADRR